MSSADRAFDVAPSRRAAMIALGFIPAIHVAAVGAAIGFGVAGSGGWLIAVGVGVLYLLPPLAVRVTLSFWPLPLGEIGLGSPAFLRWWITVQWQTLFARLPWLEEALRLVPALYSAWLRLWGAEVGALIYWSPGVTILDRALVRVGDRVIFGVGVRLTPHAIGPVAGGHVALLLAPITVGSDAIVGGYSTLLPGSVIAPGAVTPPFRSVHPDAPAVGHTSASERDRAGVADTPSQPSSVDAAAR